MSRYRIFLFPFLSLLLISYFVYHIFHGEKGLWSYFKLEERVAQKKHILEDYQNKIQSLERKIQLLHSHSLDPDLLDERARALLNYGENDEQVILDVDL